MINRDTGVEESPNVWLVPQRVSKGERAEFPEDKYCPPEWRLLMEVGWAQDSKDRPEFRDICAVLHASDIAAIEMGEAKHKEERARAEAKRKEEKAQAEAEGLHEVFVAAGFDWREPGCSMCLAMNPDKLKGHELCVSSSNRNFKGRQGRDSRTHLVSPAMAAAAAIKGHFVDIRDMV